MINVTKTYLPNFDQYVGYLKEIWDRAQLTNDGPMARRLEAELKQYLGIDHLYFCGNGTIVLQIALKMLKKQGEVITTPCSYVATTNAIIWENCTPVFADIDAATFCINPDLVEAAITERTIAIMATHVYGNACDVERLQKIADKHGLALIYDGAHAFGVKLNGRSLLSYGNFTTCSFHATKLFHTVEGGMIVMGDPTIDPEVKFMRSFGHQGNDYFSVGVNAKNSEIHAAMGLCNLPQVPHLIAARKAICDLYDAQLNLSKLQRPILVPGLEYNYAYYPVVFESEEKLEEVCAALAQSQIIPRRYFYPSLNTLPFLKTTQPCPVSESICERVVCLPLHAELPHEDVLRIAAIINQNL
ncbi:MAG: DegT/DnrJ/EryC1/StrS family aminotransferase [Cytophagia bacterium]|nr:MAG: DegT/DnrJ/EryC1/StrS family aminotransferase [Runella sp.]TAG21936.1 MAG: DegT/DnrJ/EryC1/StrS family aminotransferase [Cytophagales bacterium]TAG41120.1 MAG: DegT/DnrJ/EryC1/StrS family aminotransferase [Cytophagia bacterium]TAG57392.1 MAG: DegT/DnrJ/EryC1/StrS family aminotransferase [Runella slithyformis]TAG70913.1 MAG: DegT/DnrJ/EryC1/StrS family aminotransferase [Runella slithyformis]